MEIKKHILTLFLLLSIGITYGAEAAKKKTSPNFIFILGDDQGWTGSSVEMIRGQSISHSDFIETPSMERLAAEGMRFGYAYSPGGMCSPTRYAIQYGRTPASLLKTANYDPSAQCLERLSNLKTLPQFLKEINPNYVTAHLGKWHIPHAAPEVLGYDQSHGITENAEGNYLDVADRTPIPSDDPKRIFSLTKDACDFIKEQTETEKPFFLQISHYAVHLKQMGLQKTLDKYTAKERGKYHHRPVFAACTEDLDSGIGMVLDLVEELGIDNNTYIIYMSDNGGLADKPGEYEVNLPLKWGKFTIWDGGIRVPFFVKGPGISPNSSCNLPISGCDILPTVLELAGGNPKIEGIDGGSLTDVLKNPNKGVVNRNHKGLYFQCTRGHEYASVRRQEAVIYDDYKLIRNYFNEEALLFNVVKDPGETTDLSKKDPEKYSELDLMLSQYLSDVKAQSAAMSHEEIEQFKRFCDEQKEEVKKKPKPRSVRMLEMINF
jgi:arylsulfatase A-like enzyme